MSEGRAARVFSQMVSALGHCHSRSIVHRDLKAENLLLDEHMDVKLADFGFSNWFCGGSLVTWCGSPPYAAPELFLGHAYDGVKADIWSLGVVLYVLVCGALPFDGGTLPELRATVLAGKYRIPYFMSQECEHLIRLMLVVDPERRTSLSGVRQHRWLAQHPPYAQPDISVGECWCHAGFSAAVPQRAAEGAAGALSALGVSSDRLQQSLQEERYDNIYAMYHLIAEKISRRELNADRDSMDESIEPLDLSRCNITDEEKMESEECLVSNSQLYIADNAQDIEKFGASCASRCPARRHTVPVAPHVEFEPGGGCQLGCNPTTLPLPNYTQLPPQGVGLSPQWPPYSGKDQHLLKPPLAMRDHGVSWNRRASDGGAYPRNRQRGDNAQGGEAAGYSSSALDSEEPPGDAGYNNTLCRYMVSRGCGKRHTMATADDPLNIPHTSTSPSSSTRVRKTGLLTVTERPPGREHSAGRRASDATVGDELRAAKMEFNLLQREVDRRGTPTHDRTPSVSQPGSPCHAPSISPDPALLLHQRAQSARSSAPMYGVAAAGGSITRGTPQPANNALDLSNVHIHRSLNNSPISNPGSPLDMIQEESPNNHFHPSINTPINPLISPINPQISLTDCLGSEVIIATDSEGSVDSLENVNNRYHIPQFIISEPTDLDQRPSITKGIGRKVSKDLDIETKDQTMVEEVARDSLEFRRGSDKSLGFSDDSLSNDSTTVSPNFEQNVQSIYSNIVSISSGFSENRGSFSEHRESFSFSDRGSFSGEGTRNSFSLADNSLCMETPRTSFSAQGDKLERFDEEEIPVDVETLQKSTMDLTLTDCPNTTPILQKTQKQDFDEYYEISLSTVYSKLDSQSIVEVLKNAIKTRVPPQNIVIETDRSVSQCETDMSVSRSDQSTECLTRLLSLQYSGGVHIELALCESRHEEKKGLKLRRISGDHREYGKLAQRLISSLTV